MTVMFKAAVESSISALSLRGVVLFSKFRNYKVVSSLAVRATWVAVPSTNLEDMFRCLISMLKEVSSTAWILILYLILFEKNPPV